MRLAWVTDVHLNFLRPAQRERFHETLAAASPDAVLVGGDTGEAHDVEAHLTALARRLERPVLFVLGNHDFYRGSIQAVRARAEALTREDPFLRWLPAAGVVPLGADTALVGTDGWGDARLGNALHTPVLLNDFFHIEELTGLDVPARVERLRALGDESAARLRPRLAEALGRYRRVVVLTHVPPFREACWHEGTISHDDWLPFFTCAAVGEALREAMAARPEREMLVLCGHTHGEGVARVLPNLEVRTGGAEYGAPALQAVLDFA
jgi:Icc-related predicted phosphoesterase